jgi:hypothetical protein
VSAVVVRLGEAGGLGFLYRCDRCYRSAIGQELPPGWCVEVRRCDPLRHRCFDCVFEEIVGDNEEKA